MEKKCIPLPAKVRKCWTALFVLTLLISSFTLTAQTIQVGGTVKDNKGTKLSGVSVRVKGANIGTSTDSSGMFTLNAPSQASTLVFSIVGFLDKEETVGSQRIINVTLSEKQNNLDEIVVVGYGTQRKREVGGSISSVNAKQIMERQPVNIFDALQGQAAG
ncbi:MAG: TonB-dependent receptor, partial [Sphingobacteriales bacterium]